jgi:hypothetical protein
MSELVVLEAHTAFDEACLRARQLARDISSETTVVRSAYGWHILASAFSQAVFATAHMRTNYSTADNEFEEPYDQETRVLLVEDMSDEQTAWARSNEHGWFYDDEV